MVVFIIVESARMILRGPSRFIIAEINRPKQLPKIPDEHFIELRESVDS